MKIRAGFTVAYDCMQATPMLLVLNIHPSRRVDLLTEQVLTFNQPLEAWSYTDSFGNACSRITAPPGRTTISTLFDIYDSGLPDVVAPDAVQHDIRDLPDDVLVFLLGSRYCDTDRLTNLAWSLFAQTPPGWARVQAICDYVHNRIAFNYQNADATRTAHGGHTEQTGVCRDFAHLAITLCRCMNIPARYCTGYLGDIGVPKMDAPMDFSAWFQVYLSGHWYTFDARHNHPRIGRVLMAIGRDATDVALSTSFGPNILAQFDVVTDELPLGEARIRAARRPARAAQQPGCHKTAGVLSSGGAMSRPRQTPREFPPCFAGQLLPPASCSRSVASRPPRSRARDSPSGTG